VQDPVKPVHDSVDWAWLFCFSVLHKEEPRGRWKEPMSETPNDQDLQLEQEKRFQHMMDLIFQAHPYYRKLFAQLGLKRSHFRSLADLKYVPPTTKERFMAEPEAFRLDPSRLVSLSTPERTLAQVIYTSGSTVGNPTPFYDTNFDLIARIAQMKEASTLAGIGPDDLVANLFPLTAVLHQGFLSALYGPLAVGARMIAGMPGQPSTPFPVYQRTEEIARMIASQRCTVLWGITSYVRKVILEAQSQQLDLSAVNMVFVAGEPCPPAMRSDLRNRLRTLGATRVMIQNGYGFTEMQGPTIECAEEGPLHIPAPAQYAFEIVDPDGYMPVPEGQDGLVLITHLNRRGTVLLRYQVGDICSIHRSGTCPVCGRTGPRFGSAPVRTGDLVKVKGTLVNSRLIVEAVGACPGVVEFQVQVRPVQPDDPLSGDDLVVRVAVAQEDVEEATSTLRQVVLQACEITPRIEVLPIQAFDQEYKLKRFVDLRPQANARTAAEFKEAGGEIHEV